MSIQGFLLWLPTFPPKGRSRREIHSLLPAKGAARLEVSGRLGLPCNVKIRNFSGDWPSGTLPERGLGRSNKSGKGAQI